MKTFWEFLKQDYFVVSILSILFVVEEKLGLFCTEAFDIDRNEIWSHVEQKMSYAAPHVSRVNLF